MNDQSTPQWSSNWVFILVTAGAAVGLGNIWKFPYIAGENGGGAFVVVYLLCVFLIGMPLMMAEIMIGRAGGKNPSDTTILLAKRYQANPKWGWLGGLTLLSGFLILSYYSVIAGWAVAYVFKAIAGVFYHASQQQVDQQFESLIASPWHLAFFHFLVMLVTVSIISLGVQRGLERVGLYLFPTMLILLGVMVIYAISTGYFGHGLAFMFKPNFQALTGESMLKAIGHSFFTLSIAIGSIMMYGAYLPRRVSILPTAIAIVIADTLIATLAGLAIFPLVFAYQLKPGMGSGLIFKTLPIAFGRMPLGSFFGTLFFIMLVLAALTSTVSFLEPTSVWLMERFRVSRPKAAFITGAVIWVLGLATVFSFNIAKHLSILGMNFFDALDMLTANIMLPVGGLLIAWFAAWVMKDSQTQLGISRVGIFRLWRYSLGVLTPIAVVLIFIHALGWV